MVSIPQSWKTRQTLLQKIAARIFNFSLAPREDSAKDQKKVMLDWCLGRHLGKQINKSKQTNKQQQKQDWKWALDNQGFT